MKGRKTSKIKKNSATVYVGSFLMVCITKAHVWYIKILAWLQGFLVIFLWSFDLFFFVLKSLLGIARQWSHEKFEFLTLKPRGHVRILIHQTWTIVIRQNKLMPRLCWSVLDQNDRSKCFWTLCTFKSTLGVWCASKPFHSINCDKTYSKDKTEKPQHNSYYKKIRTFNYYLLK